MGFIQWQNIPIVFLFTNLRVPVLLASEDSFESHCCNAASLVDYNIWCKHKTS